MDAFEHALREAGEEAPLEFVESVREKLKSIQGKYAHTHSTVESCLKGLEGAPTMAHILVAAYVLNGGVSFKYQMLSQENEDPGDFDKLLNEINEKIGDIRCAI